MEVNWRIDSKKDDNQSWIVTDQNVMQCFKRMEKQRVATLLFFSSFLSFHSFSKSRNHKLKTLSCLSSLSQFHHHFFERNCAIFFAPMKSLTFTSSIKKLGEKLLYKNAACKMLVKLTPFQSLSQLFQSSR